MEAMNGYPEPENAPIPQSVSLMPQTWEEFLAWHDEDVHAEWVDGNVIMMSPASSEHQLLKLFLVQVLGLYLEQRPQGALLDAPFLMRLPERPSGREPDILFIAHERVHLIQPTFLDGAADLVVEIISPESDERDRGEKFIEYEAAGVREYWLIDPLREEAMFYQLTPQGRYRLVVPSPDGVYHSAVIAGLWLRVEWLWQRPPVLRVLKELGVL
jgi:Uma2 family endonuclease